MTLPTVWFALLALMLLTYVVLDGFDLGTGIIHFRVGRTRAEREAVLRSVGPVWDGNEVWLIAAGGTLYMAFPALYATSFSGFYLPLMLVLWLLVFRALGIELRHQLHHPLWEDFWDAAFTGASVLLALFFGAALGNVVRGVPLDDSGRFFSPLWTDFTVAEPTGILDWYTLLVGLHAVAALTLHGALWVTSRTGAPMQERAARIGRRSWVAVVALTGATTAATYVVQPQLAHNLESYPVGLVLPFVALAGLFSVPWLLAQHRHDAAFLASAAYLVGMLGSAAYGIYPYVLPGPEAGTGMTIADAATDPYALRVALWWWVPGMALATGYFVFLYRRLPRGLTASEPAESHD